MRRYICSAFAAGALLLVAGPANAVAVPEFDKATAAQGGSGSNFFTSCSAEVHSDKVDVCYNADGDYLVLQDEAKDSKRVGLHWRLADGSRRGMCWTDSGASLWFVDTGWAGPIMECNKNFVEGKTIEIRGGTCDFSSTNDCQNIVDFDEWTGWDSTAA